MSEQEYCEYMSTIDELEIIERERIDALNRSAPKDATRVNWLIDYMVLYGHCGV
jgi:hypothetical protein